MKQYHFIYGKLPKELLRENLKSLQGFVIPDDLFLFWVNSGGGEFFETETFLYPLFDPAKENVVDLNNDLRNQGLNKDYFVFYSGSFGYGALKKNHTGIFLLNTETFFLERQLASFLELVKFINEEFSSRYDNFDIDPYGNVFNA